MHNRTAASCPRHRVWQNLVCLSGMVLFPGVMLAQQDEVDVTQPSLKQAFELTKSAQTDADFTAIIEICQQSLDSGAGEKPAQYARRLMAWAHNKRGEQRAEAGRAEEALADFEQAVALDKTRWRALHNRGVSYAQIGRYDEAEADLTASIELEPRYANAWFNRGELRYQRGDLPAAIADYNEALRLKPSDAATLTSRGRVYSQQGQFQRALADLRAAIQLDPENAAAFVHRADVLADLGRFEGASSDYRAALRLDPQFGPGFQRAAWFIATCPDPRFRNPEMALRAARKAVELMGEDDVNYLDTLAAAQAAAGQFDEAVVTQTKAIKLAAELPAEERAAFEERLALYKSGRAFVQGEQRSAPRRSGGPTRRVGGAETRRGS